MTDLKKEVAKRRLQSEVRKKCWPGLFELVKAGKKNADIRLADFSIRRGDTLVLEEWNPETKKYTGRKLQKKVRAVNKVDIAKMNSLEDIRKKGVYLIEMV